MGVDTRLVVYAKNQKTAEEACAAAFERIAALDTTMSDYMKDSELTHLSNGAGGPAVKVSKDLFKVLKRSQDVSRLSDGLFDVTVGQQNIFHRERYKVDFDLTAINVTDKYALYNFLSTFSGTHYVTPRALTAKLTFNF